VNPKQYQIESESSKKKACVEDEKVRGIASSEHEKKDLET